MVVAITRQKQKSSVKVVGNMHRYLGVCKQRNEWDKMSFQILCKIHPMSCYNAIALFSKHIILYANFALNAGRHIELEQVIVLQGYCFDLNCSLVCGTMNMVSSGLISVKGFEQTKGFFPNSGILIEFHKIPPIIYTIWKLAGSSGSKISQKSHDQIYFSAYLSYRKKVKSYLFSYWSSNYTVKSHLWWNIMTLLCF